MTCAACLPPVRSLRAQHVGFAITDADTVALHTDTLAQAHFSCPLLALGTEYQRVVVEIYSWRNGILFFENESRLFFVVQQAFISCSVAFVGCWHHSALIFWLYI